MRLGSFTARLGAATVLALVPYVVQATTIFCQALEEPAIRENLQRAYSDSDLVARVDPQPVAVFSDGDEELYELRVRAVWKGIVGPTVYIDELAGPLVFATRDGESGPFESLGPCTAAYGDAALMAELFGSAYPPSVAIRESRFTPLEKLTVVAAAGVGLAILVGFVWVLSYFFASHNKRMQRTRDG